MQRVFLKNIVLNVFSFDCELMVKLLKHLVFTITHVCSICLKLDVSSLTEIQYSQIEPSEKRTHTNESMMLKMFYLYGFVRWTKCIWWAIENDYLLVYQLFEFVVEWIPLIRYKAEIYSVKKITCINAIADKKIIRVFCVSGYCAPHLRLLSLFSWNPQRKEKKLTKIVCKLSDSPKM